MNFQVSRAKFFVVVSFVAANLISPQAPAADILYVGDSHSYGYFGQEFEKSLRETTDPATHQKLTVQSAATCGSSIAGWLDSAGNDTSCGYRACGTDGTCVKQTKGHSESLLALVKKETPRVTIVALGSNMLKDKGGCVMKDVAYAIEKIKASGSECIWIGPPQAAEFFMPVSRYETFNTDLKMAVEAKGCRFIASNDKTARENLNDTMGLHYGPRDGKTWGKKVATEVAPMLKTLLVPSARTAAPTQPSVH